MMEHSILDLEEGKAASIKTIEGGAEFKRKIQNLGIREGKTIKVVTKHPLRGPLVVSVDGRQTTLGRGMAQKIIVEAKE